MLMLSDSIMGHHHQLFFDNNFTSMNLLSTLLEKGTYACGTICTNRKLRLVRSRSIVIVSPSFVSVGTW